MPDVVGLIASVLTVTQVATEGVKHAKTFYQAREEFETLQASITILRLFYILFNSLECSETSSITTLSELKGLANCLLLQEQLEQFRNLVTEINDQHAISSSTVIATSLSSARLTIQQLDQLIAEKILKNVDGTSRARRRAWMRNKSKIYESQDALKEHRENLSAAISANSLSSANRSESTMTVISRDFENWQETSLSVDRRLLEIQQSLLETHQAVLSQTNTVKRILQSHQLSCDGQLDSTEQQEASVDNSASQSRRHPDLADTLPSSAAKYFQGNELKPAPNISASVAHVFPRSTVSPEPASPFEVSRNFFPEIYTTEQRLPNPCLVITSSYEEMSSDDSKINFYRLFYLKSPRQWHRISISIKICRSSMYWAATKVSQRQYNTQDSLPLLGAVSAVPSSLLTEIQKFLSEAEDIHEDVHLRLSLLDRDSVQKQHLVSQIYSFPTTTELSNAPQDVLTFLDDLGCPRYFEDQITQITVLEPPNRFASCVNGIIVYETKFARSLPSHELLYNIQVLRCMDGDSGFAKFYGIVIDTTGKHLKSYLSEFPRRKWSLISEEIIQNRSIPWKRREQWARQLVEGVSKVHSKSLVVGTFSYLRLSIFIDSQDCIQFWRFQNKFHMGCVLGCYYPPEFRRFRHASKSTPEAECPKMTPKTDIFQLGMVLWFLAENLPRERSARSPVCVREGRNIQSGPCYDESHVDPIALPRLPESIPQYFRDVVDACRAEDPKDRLPAQRLLKLFPATSGPSESAQTETVKPGVVDINLLRKVVMRMTICDRCRKPVEAPFFHCNICDVGDYDICLACYDGGLHCRERHHLLVEMKYNRSWNVAQKYHSSTNSSGNRDVFEL